MPPDHTTSSLRKAVEMVRIGSVSATDGVQRKGDRDARVNFMGRLGIPGVRILTLFPAPRLGSVNDFNLLYSLDLVKRSWALRRRNPTRDSQAGREAGPPALSFRRGPTFFPPPCPPDFARHSFCLPGLKKPTAGVADQATACHGAGGRMRSWGPPRPRNSSAVPHDTARCHIWMAKRLITATIAFFVRLFLPPLMRW